MKKIRIIVFAVTVLLTLSFRSSHSIAGKKEATFWFDGYQLYTLEEIVQICQGEPIVCAIEIYSDGNPTGWVILKNI